MFHTQFSRCFFVSVISFETQPILYRGESNKRKELSFVQNHPPGSAPPRGAGLWTWEVCFTKKKKTNQQKKSRNPREEEETEENDVRHVLVFRGFKLMCFMLYLFWGNDTNLTHIFQRWLKPPASVAVDLLKVIFYGFHHGKSPSKKNGGSMWGISYLFQQP